MPDHPIDTVDTVDTVNSADSADSAGSAGPDRADTDTEAGADAAAAAGLSTAPLEETGTPTGPEPAGGGGSFGGVRQPGLTGGAAWLGRELAGWVRWFWRQLTSMRVALLLLFLLALASVPGSLIPQDSVDPFAADDFRGENGTLAEVYDKLQLFDVYSSVWFSAIYLLLFVSLVGCILPRSWQFAQQLRGRPPRAPRHLDRMPAFTTWRTETAPAEVLDAGRTLLRRRRFRTDAGEDPAPRASSDASDVGGWVAAEKGYLREAGNLLFHLALVVMLVAFAYGQLYYSEGGKLVVEGDAFSNTLTQYDDFTSGSMFDVDDLDRFGFTLEDFHADFARSGPDLGTATEFRADVSYWTADDPDTEHQATIEVNEPLEIDDSKVYLLGHGFAPVVSITDGQGDLAYRGPVPFLPQDDALTSSGVIKVTDYVDENGEPDQLGFQGFFNPTYNIDAQRGPHSTFPEPDLPVLTLTAYHGDLGLDAGIPQNVYQLDTSHLEQLRGEGGEPFRFNLVPGQSTELPGGKGTITFERLDQWATFQISTKAGNGLALTGALVAVVGLAASLLLQRRRVWLRARPGGGDGDGKAGATVVEMASLGRTESPRLPEELASLAAALYDAAPPVPPDDPVPDQGAQGART